MSDATAPWETPDPYRMLYQLAAQHLNAAQEQEHERRGAQRADVVERRRRAVDRHAASARAVAAELQERAEGYVRGHDVWAQQAPLFSQAWRQAWPSARDDATRRERLRAFLWQTVIPCAALVGASARLLGASDTEIAEPELIPVRGRIETISYRAYYNLACYEARRSRVPGAAPAVRRAALDAAFDALQHALGKATGQRRAELGRWAQRDPVLEALYASPRDRLRFAGLLDTYAIPRQPNA